MINDNELISSASAIKNKDQERAKNQKLIEEFLAKGKHITVCDSGISTPLKPAREYYRTAKAV